MRPRDLPLDPASEVAPTEVRIYHSAAMSSLRLRAAAVGDASAIAALIASEEDARQVAPTEPFPITAETVESWIVERETGYVLEDESGVLAYGEINPDAGVRRRAWIGHVVVSRYARGTGMGRQMVRGLATVARDALDAKDVWLSAFADNPPALACYRGAGFRETGRREMFRRELVDMVYDPPHLRRLLGPGAVTLFGAIAAGGTAALLPSSTRFWLMDATGGRQTLVLAVALVVSALGARLLHPLLPRGLHRGTDQLLRPFVFGLALGVVVALALTLAIHAIGMPISSLTNDLIDALLGGLQFGGGWGLLLVIFAQTRHWAR